MSIKLDLNVDDLAKQMKEFRMEFEQDIQKAVSGLAAMTHAHVLEKAQQELHSTRKIFTDNLGFEEIADGVWVVSVGEPALFIEEGIEPNTDMKQDLLKNGAKTSKDGHKYRSIPFHHDKPASQNTGYAQNLVNKVKAKLKQEGVPFKKIEKTPEGSPRLGKLHTFDFGGELPSAKANTPVLKGLSIYQSMTKSGGVRRDIMTFRTVSDGPASADKFIHPGLVPKHYLEDAASWAEKLFETESLPEILEKYK